MILSASAVVPGLWQGVRVESAGAPRTISEVRARFIERLNAALLRPGMFGGELTLRVVLDDLAWLDGQEAVRPGINETLRAAGAWSPIGVSGVFMQMFGRGTAEHHGAVGLIYADVAHAWGYLRPQRTLTDQEYSGLRRRARPWTASADRTVPDLVRAFGQPSLWRPEPCWLTTIPRNSPDHQRSLNTTPLACEPSESCR